MILAWLLLLSGWGWATIARKSRVALWEAVVAAISCSGGWLVLLALLGVAWKPWWTIVPMLLGLAIAFCQLKTLRHQLPLHPVPAAVVAVALGMFSQLPAWGWDFRYQWGLKAKVFASVGGFDEAWLGNQHVAFANPHYPPLWPTLLSFAMAFGASAEQAAGVWTALLRVGLASACWSLAAKGGVGKRWAAAMLGAFAPVLFRPFFSGYAEPLVAFLLASALTVATREQQSPASFLWLSGSLLGLAKAEGFLWLACLGATWWRSWQSKQRLAFLLSCVPPVAWFFWVHKVLPDISFPDSRSEKLVVRLFSFPQAFLQAGAEAQLAFLVFCLAVFAGWGRTPLPKASLAFALGLSVVYLTGPHPLAWWLKNSLVRVLAVPLPALLAPVLASSQTHPLPHSQEEPPR